MSAPHPFHTWLARQLETRKEAPRTWAELARATDTNQGAFTRWGAGLVNPSIEMVRRVAKALQLDPLRLMVIAEILEPSEVRQQVIVPDPTLLTDDELIAEVERRIKRRAHPDEVRPTNSPTPLFQA